MRDGRSSRHSFAEMEGGSVVDMVLVDLFSGCGGFTLGAKQAGFRVAAAFDNDLILSFSYQFNFPETKLLLEDVRGLTGEAVTVAAGGRVDGIFGGPPCQGFSDIGRHDARDPRRELLGHFFRLVHEVKPTFFVMENVRGLAYSDALGELDNALKLVDGAYAILGPHIWDAAQFGAATKRPRLFVIGVHKDRAEPLRFEDIAVLKRPPATVRAAISDLADATLIEEKNGFDVWQRGRRAGRPFDYARSLHSADGLFTNHKATVHTAEVIRRFDGIPQGGEDQVGRHPRLAWFGQCPALRAGTGADRGSYQAVRPIHPSEPRVITVREAARLQGFPDSHRFHPTIWHSFRMIGNSVSPVIAGAIFAAVKSRFEDGHTLPLAAE
jgi:DNA (cytosine-5)-methyltransferase 1